MDKKAIDLASAINVPVEELRFEEVCSTCDGAILWDVWDITTNEHRYIIEGETGELLTPIECTEAEAIEAFNN